MSSAWTRFFARLKVSAISSRWRSTAASLARMSSFPMSTWVPSSSVPTSSVVSFATGSANSHSRIPMIARNRSSGPTAFQRKIFTAMAQSGRKRR